jgi:hypothetical protein
MICEGAVGHWIGGYAAQKANFLAGSHPRPLPAFLNPGDSLQFPPRSGRLRAVGGVFVTVDRIPQGWAIRTEADL